MSARYRIEWRPGTDELLGICHCGADHVSADPIELWEWLLAHPAGHHGESEPVDAAGGLLPVTAVAVQ